MVRAVLSGSSGGNRRACRGRSERIARSAVVLRNSAALYALLLHARRLGTWGSGAEMADLGWSVNVKGMHYRLGGTLDRRAGQTQNISTRGRSAGGPAFTVPEAGPGPGDLASVRSGHSVRLPILDAAEHSTAWISSVAASSSAGASSTPHQAAAKPAAAISSAARTTARRRHGPTRRISTSGRTATGMIVVAAR